MVSRLTLAALGMVVLMGTAAARDDGLKTWRATVVVGGRYVQTYVDARSMSDAKALFESQYGRDNVKSGIFLVPKK